MLQGKDTTIVSEIKTFFTSEQKALDCIFKVISSFSLSRCKFIKTEHANNQYQNHDKLILLLLFPFFSVKDVSHFKSSSLFKILSCGKDVFYRLLNCENVDWRRLGYSINKQLFKQIKSRTENQEGEKPLSCLIVDDTDLRKEGKCFELVGRIFSHVSHKSIIGFKGLFLAFHDGKSLFGLDFSSHGEKGKNKKKPYGLNKSQLDKRFSKKRVAGKPNKIRHDEYFESKIDNLLAMVRSAINQGIRFDYLLVDSWFTCYKIVKFIKTRKINCHFLGMIKMGTTKYLYQESLLSSKQILEKVKRSKGISRLRNSKFHYVEVIVEFQGIPVKLFFSKASKKGKWHGLLTTNTELNFKEAIRIYSIRWSIEVFFKEAKNYLRLGKCESTDFDAQIAHTTICMIQFNILSIAKRFSSYETLGELFRQAEENSLELIVSERIWLIMTEIINEFSEIFEIEIEEIMTKIIADNQRVANLLKYSSFADTA